MQLPARNADDQPVRILHLEDDLPSADLVRRAFETDGVVCSIRRVERSEEFEAALAQSQFDLILSSYSLPAFDGLAALKIAQRICPAVPFILISGRTGENFAVEALKSGAVDYLLKDQLHRLGPSVRRALREAREKAARHEAEEQLRDRDELFRQITENMDDLVTILDCQGRHLFNSPSFRKFGLDPDAWVGLSAFEHVVPEDRPHVHRVFSDMVKTGENQRTEYRTVLPDGQLRHFEARGSIVRDKREQVHRVVVVARDITERKQAEERLRLLEAAVQNANEAFIITDARVAAPGPEVLFVNAAFCAMTGFRPEEVIGPTRTEIGKAPGTPDPVQIIRSPLNWAGPLRGEGLTRRRDGSEFWMEWYCHPLRDAQKQITHYLIVQRDVTAKKKAEAQIREQAALLDHAHDAICVMDMEQRILYWNQGSERLFGWDAAEVLGQSAVSLLFHGDQSSLALALKGLISRGEWRGEITHVAQAGHEVYVESRWTLLRDDHGRPKSILLINTDITERKLAEMKVREQAALLDQAQDAIYVCDLERRITYWNKGAERLYSWAAAEVLGQRASELLSGEGLVEREEIWATALEAGEWSGELPQVTRSGRQLIVASRRTVLRDARGRNAAVLHINTDITERKHLETQFLRSQRLENIGALAGGIAHDLNNILSPILMVTDVLREDLLEEESRQMMDTVKSSAERGADLVRQILSFARGVGSEPAVFNLRHVIKDVVRMARSTFSPSIQIETRISEDLRSVRGDPTRLHQVLMNLGVNARDAMQHGGRLLIEAENVLLNDRNVPGQLNPVSGLYVRLSVIDSGSGIPPHLQEKIFLPFFTTKPVGQGTGLGLSTVANIVRDHGGFVEVRSQVGEGTTFDVYLPATLRTEPVVSSPPPAEPPLGRGERILLVDDDRAVLEMTRQALKAYHYEVVLASNGAEALEAYQNRTRPIDLVITDLQMPVMDGPSFVREMHRLDPRLKIICVSGLASESKLADLDRAKVAILLGKPYTAERLLSTIHKVLAS